MTITPFGWQDNSNTWAASAANMESFGVHIGAYTDSLVGNTRFVTANTTLTANDALVVCDATGVGTPTNLTATVHPGAGSLAATTGNQGYLYTVSAVNAGREGIPLHEGIFAQATPANASITVGWTPPSGTVTGYNIYRISAFDISNPMATYYQYIATVGAGATSYTDAGATATATTPPANNGAAFTVTLPDATSAAFQGHPFTIRHDAETVNLVTVATTGGQSIKTSTRSYSTITLGTVGHVNHLGSGAGITNQSWPGAQFLEVTVISDGTNWRVLRNIPVPVTSWFGGQVGVNCPANQYTIVAITPLPTIHRWQSVSGMFSVKWAPPTGASIYEVVFGLNFCDVNGNAPSPYTRQQTNWGYWPEYTGSAGTFFTANYDKVSSGAWTTVHYLGDPEINARGTYQCLTVYPVGTGSINLWAPGIWGQAGGLSTQNA